jgi:hypothetical protein
MPLQSVGQSPFPGDMNHGAGVIMLDGEKPVTVFATELALHDCEPDLPPESLIGVFVRHLKEIEAVASEKYDRGERLDEDTVVILSEDLRANGLRSTD